jgi:hypothetical protein
MLGMPTFDFTSERGKQDFQKWITFSIKNEINSYSRQVLGTIDNSVTATVNNYFGNLDGGFPDSTYGGISPIDLGGVT